MERVSFGILGCGNIAETVHIPNLLNIAEVRIHGLCDTSPERLQTVGDKFSIPKEQRYTEVTTFLETDFDAVLILSPTSSHGEHVALALERGKHVFVEKPLCEGLTEALRLAALAAEKERILAVGHFYGFFPQHQLAKKHLAKIGEVKYVDMVGQTLTIKPEDGALFDYATHFIHLLLWYFDYPDFSWVMADLVSEGSQKETDVHILAKLSNGVRAKITTLWVPEFNNWDVVNRHVEIVGTKGKLVAQLTSPELKVYRADTLLSRARGLYSITPTFALHYSVPVSQTSYRKELEDFVDAVRTGGEPAVSGRVAIRVMEFGEAARISHREGRRVGRGEIQAR